MALELNHSTLGYLVSTVSWVICVCLSDGTRVASSTGIDLLLLDDFKLIINDVTYHVRPPKRGKPAWFWGNTSNTFQFSVKLQNVKSYF